MNPRASRWRAFSAGRLLSLGLALVLFAGAMDGCSDWQPLMYPQPAAPPPVKPRPTVIMSPSTEDIAAIWDDPTFQKEFVAGYGVNAEIEPRVSQEEMDVLEKILPKMKNERPAARQSPGNPPRARTDEMQLQETTYQCREPLNWNGGNPIVSIGKSYLTPEPTSLYEHCARWREVIPPFLERKPVVFCKVRGAQILGKIQTGSILFLTHCAMAYTALSLTHLTENYGRANNKTCELFLRRWGAMYQQQKEAAIQSAKVLAGIP